MLLLSLAAGLALLILGGELLLRGAVALSLRLGLSPLFIGLTVVGFGTSTPELFTSLQATFSGAPDIALGNVIGSNIANALLILGAAALMAPMAVRRAALYRDGIAVMLATLACTGLALTGSFTPLSGVLLLAGLAAYLLLAWKTESAEAPEPLPQALPPLAALALTAGGIALTLLGARFLVSGAVELATTLGVSEAVIGLTIVAVGTSLPELVTSIMAARKGQPELALGNVLGSNIYNILGILGATALLSPAPLDASAMVPDALAMLAATTLMLVLATTGWRITRTEGGLLLAPYAAYLIWLIPA
ncbi:MAG: calcium/sodium antiporter [Vannielia sp.]|uniref:calcium/sodium antiporter n=1 Tax=Rhodobacterales TaxID=204455 RepID=UPI0020954BD4|nr:calcium/sodium antiporter [Oceanicola sp. 502str15]MCO6382217.1 calcium/sodium antiporter [Oceanicola sp. 502str15]